MVNKAKQTLRNLLRLLKFIWKEDKWLVIAYLSTSVLGALLLFIVYFVYKLMIDRVTEYAAFDQNVALIAVIISYLFFEYLSRFVNFTFNQYYFDYFIRVKLQNSLTRKFMDKLSRLDFAHLENGDTRNLIAKVENSYAFRLPEILNKLNAIVYNVAALIFSFAIALQFDFIYFLLLTVVSVPIYYLRAKYSNIAFSNYSANAPKTNYLWYLRSIFTNFQTLSEMKIYGLRGHFVHKAKELQDEVLEDYRKPMSAYALISSVSFILIPVAIYFAVVHFINQFETRGYTIGDFTFFLNTLFTFSGQISSLLINIGVIYENSFFMNEFFRLLNIQNIISSPRKPFKFDEVGPRTIEFVNVSFSYPGTENLSLHNVSFTIPKGLNVAIVGHNGAGKSSLIKLLFRFYDPTEGKILIDGVDLREIDVEHWYEHLGVLFQDYARYFLTLKENIMYGNLKNASFEDAQAALSKAQGLGLLGDLPKGYDQFVGRWFEGGIEMSGGQWQKVAIARAIFRNAPVLIMDEPTAAIDADAEHEIFESLRELYRNKNLIFISHRFSTVRTADYIFVLEKGRLVEKGTHSQLLYKKGLYSEFFALQRRGYE